MQDKYSIVLLCVSHSSAESKLLNTGILRPRPSIGEKRMKSREWREISDALALGVLLSA